MGSVLAATGSGLILPGQVCPVLPNQLAVPNGLIGYWNFAPDTLDFTANRVIDMAGYRHDGTLNNCVAADLGIGQIGGALTTTGFKYVSVASNAAFSLTNMTLCAWVRPTSVSGSWQTIIEHNRNASNWYGLFVSGNGSLFHARTDNVTGIDFSTTIVNNRWYHVAFTFNGSTQVRFLNGAVDSTSSGLPTPTPTDDVMQFGVNMSIQESFSGAISEIRIYNRALSAGEIMALYQAGLAGRRTSKLQLSWYAEMPALNTAGGGGAANPSRIIQARQAIQRAANW